MSSGSIDQQAWRSETLGFVASVNDLIETIHRDGWSEGLQEPIDTDRERLAESALNAVREANAARELADLRSLWPPAHAPFVSSLGERGQPIPVLGFLQDGSLLARIATPARAGRTVRISGDTVTDTGLGLFGQSADGKFLAVAASQGVTVTAGHGGAVITELAWPTGLKATGPEPVAVDRIVPFDNGERCLVVGEAGIWVLSASGARRILPTESQLRTWREEAAEDGFEFSVSLAMAHGAVSADDRYIAVGSQDGLHLVYDSSLELVGEIGHYSEYPHYALFSQDSSIVALNSCHFYSGATVGVPTSLLGELKTEPYEPDDRFVTLDEQARVYAGVARGDEVIIGDAGGYVTGIGLDGAVRWRQFIGSTVGDIAISADGSQLAVSTYAGIIAIFELDAGEQAPHQIGFGGHRDVRRWLFWRGEEMPLAW